MIIGSLHVSSSWLKEVSSTSVHAQIVCVCVCVYAWMDNFMHCRASDTLMFEILDLSIIEARSTISAQPVSSTAISRSRS